MDDEPKIREFLARWVTAAGHEVREAPDAETAFALIGGFVSDVVLCDVDMPGLGGLWLVERLHEQFPTVAVVLATAADWVPPPVTLRGGVVDYLLKPLERDRVLAAIANGLEWRRAAMARAGVAQGPDPIDEWMSGKK